MACCHVARTEVVVVAAGHRRHAKLAVLKGKSKIYVLGLLVETANLRVTELSRFHVVDRSAIDVNLIVALV